MAEVGHVTEAVPVVEVAAVLDRGVAAGGRAGEVELVEAVVVACHEISLDGGWSTSLHHLMTRPGNVVGLEGLLAALVVADGFEVEAAGSEERLCLLEQVALQEEGTSYIGTDHSPRHSLPGCE